MPRNEPAPESDQYLILEEQINQELQLKASSWSAGIIDLDAIDPARGRVDV